MDLLFHGGRSGEKTGEGLCRIPIGSVTTARRARTVSARRPRSYDTAAPKRPHSI